jgi:hypothetical protein
MSNEALRAEHDAVLASLSTRESTRHFARATVGGFVGLMLGGTAAKLWQEGGASTPMLVTAGLTVAALLSVVVRGVLGRSAHRRERAQLERLRELRATLELDAPASVPATTS